MIARLHILILFAVGLAIASCEPVAAPAPSIEVKRTKSGQICGKTETSAWRCVKE